MGFINDTLFKLIGKVHVLLTLAEIAEIYVTSEGDGTSFMWIKKNNYFREANKNEVFVFCFFLLLYVFFKL